MSEFRNKLKWLPRRPRKEAELREELEFHLAEQAEESKAFGLTESQARFAARRELGNVALIAEDTRAKWGWPVLEQFFRDLQFAWRTLLRSPSFTSAAVLTLALGIGSTSAIFSVARGVLLKPLPYRDPDRIVSVFETKLRASNPRNSIGPANFVEWRERSRSLEHIGMTATARQNLVLNGQPEEVTGAVASSDVFQALGVSPLMGRAFSPEEDLAGKDQVMLLSYEFWRARLQGRDDVIGLKMTTSGAPRTVIGVMPPEFTIAGQKADFFITYGWTIEGLRSTSGRGSSTGIARLRDGVTFQQAAAEMKNIAAQLEKEFPDRDTNWTVTLVPVHEQTVDQIRPAILILAGAVALVLLIACVNVANLLLARSTVRQRELGVRAALGAGRGRLIGQMLTESLLLGAAGGAAGLVLAIAFHRGLLSLVADRIPVPRLSQVTLDLQVVAVTFGLALATGLLFGVVPALVTSRSLNDSLREGGRHGVGSRSRGVLRAHVVTEIAFALVLLVCAGLLIRSLLRLQETNPGFRADGVLTARVQLAGTRYADPRQGNALFYGALDRISAAPGVQSAAGTAFLPMTRGIGTGFYRTDRPAPSAAERPSTDVRPVTPGFFRTMGIPLLSGRDFTAADTIGTRLVAIISETLARRYFLGENPIGKQLIVRIGPPDGPWEIIGVVGDIKLNSLDGDIRPAVWTSQAQLGMGQMSFVVRTERDPLSLVNTVREAVRAIDPELPLADILTMDEVVVKTLARPRTVAALLSVFAVMALVLAGVGVYGVMAYSVAQRRPEIGIRIALGATRSTLVRTIVGEALLLAGIGLALGLAGSLALTCLLETQLTVVSTNDPMAFAGVTVLLGATALIASLIPAWRAATVDPLVALRAE